MRASRTGYLKASSILLAVWVTAHVLVSCGGSPPPTASAGGPANDAPFESGEEETGPSEEAPSAPEPVRPNCDDGTCFLCGDGMCPVGAYCDGDAEGGPACAWISECRKEASCACVTKVLGAGCRCEDASGGSTVSCR